MGLGGLHFWHLLILLVIVILLFGSKRLRDVGADLGHAIRGFKKALSDPDAPPPGGAPQGTQAAPPRIEPPQSADSSRDKGNTPS